MTDQPPLPADLPRLPPRAPEGHKGDFGRVMIVAGSRGMSGAAILAGRSALRGGAGLVYLAVPDRIADVVASAEPAWLVRPLPCDAHGRLSAHAGDELDASLQTMDVLAIGPGLGQSDELTRLVTRLYRDWTGPMVVDADALNALASSSGSVANHNGPRVLTPHPGEFSRLTGLPTRDIQSNRRQLAQEFADRHRLVLLLKGDRTVITDGSQVFLNETGNPGMATGGTGDVLTGLIAALIGQQLSCLEAARLGAWMHGRAGDLAAADHSLPGLISSDLPDYLGRVWKELL